MNILNNIRYAIAITTLTIGYICVAISGVFLEITDLVSGSKMSHTDWTKWLSMYMNELDVIKLSLL